MRNGIIFGAGLAVALAGAIWLIPLLGDMTMPFDATAVHHAVSMLGAFGPVVLVAMMVAAVVISPIPSGPIAVAAGALYGVVWGGVLSIVGALVGAMIAFGAARYLGFDAIRRSDNPVLKYISAPRSQLALMGLVFASRLIPFISFDAVSYAAGVTNLSFWRFVLATLAGVVPIGFALAAIGAGMIGADKDWTPYILLAGGITLLPLIVRWVWLRLVGGKPRV